MTAAVSLLSLACLVLLLAALGLAASRARRGTDAPPRGVLALSAAAAVVLGAALVLWWREVGHGPYLGRFEVYASDAWLLLVAFLALARRAPGTWRLSTFVLALAAALVLAAVAAGPEAIPLPAPMRSGWLVVHATAHKLAFAALALATAIALGEATGRLRGGPDARRWGGAGFALWTVGMLSGSLWGHAIQGSFWGWDAVEIWSLAAWGVLGAQMHYLRFYAPGPRARAAVQAASLAIAAFALFASPLLRLGVHTAYLPR